MDSSIVHAIREVSNLSINKWSQIHQGDIIVGISRNLRINHQWPNLILGFAVNRKETIQPVVHPRILDAQDVRDMPVVHVVVLEHTTAEEFVKLVIEI